jgi:protoheme IX farnesyltransferase
VSALRDWLALTKARIQAFATPAAAVCAWIAADGDLPLAAIGHLALGLTLVSSAAAALNQVLEVRIDAAMERTRDRPLPSGRISVRTATIFGTVAGVSGAAWLMLFLNPLCAWLAVVMLASYCFVYTPLKRVTPLNTVVGAFPGALPLLVGYAAADRGLTLEAGVLFLILFLWQLPHFFSIAWLYREDYARGGLRMLSNVDATGEVSGRQAVHWALALLPASLLPTLFSLAGRLYFYAAFSLSLIFLAFVLGFGLRRSAPRARRVLWASLIYLPALFTFLVLDRTMSR